MPPVIAEPGSYGNGRATGAAARYHGVLIRQAVREVGLPRVERMAVLSGHGGDTV